MEKSHIQEEMGKNWNSVLREKKQKIQTNMEKNNKIQNYNIINQKNSKIDIEKQWQQSDVPKAS